MTLHTKRLHLWLLVGSLILICTGIVLYLVAPDGPLREWEFYILAPIAIGLGMLPVTGLSLLAHFFIERNLNSE